eukprot:1228084-Amorphochlora_amoeboformis.AAC.1
MAAVQGLPKINANPTVYKAESVEVKGRTTIDDEDTPDPFDSLEIYELIRNINDPEHPLTLEQVKRTAPWIYSHPNRIMSFWRFRNRYFSQLVTG